MPTRNGLRENAEHIQKTLQNLYQQRLEEAKFQEMPELFLPPIIRSVKLNNPPVTKIITIQARPNAASANK